MPTQVEELQARVATLQKEADASKEKAAALKELQDKHATLEKSHLDFVGKVAALSGAKSDKDEKPAADKVITGLSDKIASLDKDLTDLKKAAAQKEADSWADSVVKSKEIAMDAKPKLASLYLNAKEAALDLEKSLPQRVLKPGVSDAHLDVEKLEGKAAEEQLAFIGGAFGKTKVKA